MISINSKRVYPYEVASSLSFLLDLIILQFLTKSKSFSRINQFSLESVDKIPKKSLTKFSFLLSSFISLLYILYFVEGCPPTGLSTEWILALLARFLFGSSLSSFCPSGQFQFSNKEVSAKTSTPHSLIVPSSFLIGVVSISPSFFSTDFALLYLAEP